MANKIITATHVTKETLRVVHNNIVFAKGVNRGYSAEFASSGAKIGNTANVRLPNTFYVSRGPSLSPQNLTENTVPVTITTQWHVDVNFGMAERTLSMQDFSNRVVTPAAAKLASVIDMDGLLETLNIYNYVGTPGTLIGTSGGTFTSNPFLNYNTPNIFLNAGVRLTNQAIPKDKHRRIILDPLAHANSIAGLTGLLNPAAEISAQYRAGVFGNALGFEFAEDQNLCTFTSGAQGGTPLVATSAGQTGSQLITNGWTANTAVLNPGDIFTIAGVYEVNPENQQSTGQLQPFVVGGYSVLPNPGNPPTINMTPVTSDANGYATIPISPAIIPIGPTVSNGTVSAAPALGAAITTIFTAATSYKQSLAYHQDAFTLATVDLEMPNGVDFSAREVYDGFSLRIVQQYDIGGDNMPCRMDILGGWKTIRPSFACRMTQ